MGKEGTQVRIDPEDHAKDNQIRLLSICTTARILTTPCDQDDASHRDIVSLTIHNMKVIPCAGIVMGLLAGIISSVAAFMVKMLPDVNPIQIVVSRSLIQLLFYLPIVMWKRQSLWGEKGERLFLLARGFVGFTAFSLTYVAFRMIPLADVITIVFSAPIYVSIFACIFLSESCGIFQFLAISLTIGGTLLISKPTFLFDSDDGESVTQVNLRTEGTVMAFVASLLLSLTFIFMRKLKKTSTPVIITVFSIESIVLGSGILFIMHSFFYEEAGEFSKGIGLPQSMREVFLLSCNGICGVLGLLFMTVGLKIEEAGLMSLVRTIDIVMAFLFQISFLPNEVIHWTSILGAVLVCSSVLISGLRRWLVDKPGTCDLLWFLLTCGEVRQGKDANQFLPESKVLTGTSTSVTTDVNENDSNFMPAV